MSPWLRAVAEWNPVSSLAQAMRELWGNGPPAPEMPPPSRTQVDGLVVGIDVENDENLLRSPIVSIYQPDQRRVRTYALREIKRLAGSSARQASAMIVNPASP